MIVKGHIAFIHSILQYHSGFDAGVGHPLASPAHAKWPVGAGTRHFAGPKTVELRYLVWVDHPGRRVYRASLPWRLHVYRRRLHPCRLLGVWRRIRRRVYRRRQRRRWDRRRFLPCDQVHAQREQTQRNQLVIILFHQLYFLLFNDFITPFVASSLSSSCFSTRRITSMFWSITPW